MTQPKELWENTRLYDKFYPLNMFVNASKQATVGQNILFLHWHEHFEIIVMKEGTAEFRIDSFSYETFPGDVLIVPSGGLHVGYSTSSGPNTYISIVFNASLMADLLHDPVFVQYVKPFTEGRIRFPILLDRKDESLSPIRTLLQQVIEEFHDKQPAYPLIVKSYLLLVFTLLARIYSPEKLQERPSQSLLYNRDRFKPLIHQLETNHSEKLTLQQAAKMVNLNPYHFCKLFKKLTGRTFVEYSNMCRMREADSLLRGTSLSVTEIAAQVGYGNPNYFTKLFKQFMGITPSEARK